MMTMNFSSEASERLASGDNTAWLPQTAIACLELRPRDAMRFHIVFISFSPQCVN